MSEKLPVGVNLHTCGKHQAKRDKLNKKQQIVISRPKAVVACLSFAILHLIIGD